MTESVRLAKRLIEQIHCSRSDAEQYIESGWVLVDGKVIDQPQFMVQHQQITLHPEAVLTPIEPVTLLLHLTTPYNPTDTSIPLSLLTPAAHAPSDTSGIRPLTRHFSKLMHTMPLAAGATGLQVYTQDKRVVKRLVEDAARNEQEYHVDVTGNITPNGLASLSRSMTFNGKTLLPAKVSLQNENRLRFALKTVAPGQIEFMCQSVGLTVIAMKRMRIGRVPMLLQAGQWRYLPAGVLF